MPISALGIYWAVLATIGAFVILALCIMALGIIHNKRIRDSESRFLFSCLINAQRIKESENQFRILFEQAFDATILLDGLCRVAKVNNTFCQLIGCSEDKLYHRTLSDLAPQESWGKLQDEFIKCLASGMGYLGNSQFQNKAGKLIQVEVGATCLKIDGKTFLFVRFRDISANEKILEELKKKNNALSVLMAHLESEKLKYRSKIAETIEQQMIPILRQAVVNSGSSEKEHLKKLEQNLLELASSSMAPKAVLKGLTAREIEICMMIKNGYTSKDIANALNLSKMTIHKHRERIRRKLGLANKNISLTAFLRSL